MSVVLTMRGWGLICDFPVVGVFWVSSLRQVSLFLFRIFRNILRKKAHHLSCSRHHGFTSPKHEICCGCSSLTVHLSKSPVYCSTIVLRHILRNTSNDILSKIEDAISTEEVRGVCKFKRWACTANYVHVGQSSRLKGRVSEHKALLTVNWRRILLSPIVSKYNRTFNN